MQQFAFGPNRVESGLVLRSHPKIRLPLVGRSLGGRLKLARMVREAIGASG